MNSYYIKFILLIQVVSVNAFTANAASGTPGWVTRGNAAVTQDDSRIFYGVAGASGIKNPALLRSTADNRARAEIAKVFEVFSATLMHDYQDSSGTQNVQQAGVTLSAMSLEGVQIVDRYIDNQGTMYALASLDLVKVAAAIKQAKELGAVKSFIDKNSLATIFDKNAATPEIPKAPAIAKADNSNTKAPEKSTSNTASKKGGEKPAWVEGKDANYAWQKFLCAVGLAPERPAAENAAYASLSKIFVAHVASVSEDFMGAYSASGGKSLEIQSSESLTQVSTEKVFTGVYIPEVWEDQKAKQLYALACLDRAKTARILQEQIQKSAAKAGQHLNRAKSADDKAGQLREFARALDALAEREALNGELRIIDIDGVGIASEYSLVDVAAAMEDVMQALKIGVFAKGPNEEDFRGALIEGLTDRGYQVTELESPKGSDLDVIISASIRMEDAPGTGAASNLGFVRGVVQVEVKNANKGKIITSMTESRKEGHKVLEEAQRRAVRALAKTITDKVGEKIDNAMKGR